MPKRKTIVFRNKTFTRRLPVNVETSLVKFFAIHHAFQCPDLIVYYFRKINAIAEGTLFKSLIPLKLSAPLFRKRLTTQTFKSILSIILKWNKVVLPEQTKPYVIIHDQWTQNYYHWITQALPRIIMTRRVLHDFTLLLPDTHSSPFHRQSLEKLGITYWETLLPNERYYYIKELYFPGHDITIGDYNDDLIRELSGGLSNHSTDASSLHLFINRRSAESRAIGNLAEVLEAMRESGFTIVEFEGMSFQQQIDLCGRAKTIAGVHGAGLTNMMFMPPGSNVLELTSRIDGEQYYYYTLSQAMDHRYFYQLCEPDDHAKNIQQSNMTVDIERLKSNLNTMLGH